MDTHPTISHVDVAVQTSPRGAESRVPLVMHTVPPLATTHIYSAFPTPIHSRQCTAEIPSLVLEGDAGPAQVLENTTHILYTPQQSMGNRAKTRLPVHRPSQFGVGLGLQEHRYVSMPESIGMDVVAENIAKAMLVNPRSVSMPNTYTHLTRHEYCDRSEANSLNTFDSSLHVSPKTPDISHALSGRSTPDSVEIIDNSIRFPTGFLCSDTLERGQYYTNDDGWISWASSPPRPIPALHGPASLPYARCPSGAEGTIIGEPENVPRLIWGLGEDRSSVNPTIHHAQSESEKDTVHGVAADETDNIHDGQNIENNNLHPHSYRGTAIVERPADPKTSGTQSATSTFDITEVDFPPLIPHAALPSAPSTELTIKQREELVAHFQNRDPEVPQRQRLRVQHPAKTLAEMKANQFGTSAETNRQHEFTSEHSVAPSVFEIDHRIRSLRHQLNSLPTPPNSSSPQWAAGFTPSLEIHPFPSYDSIHSDSKGDITDLEALTRQLRDYVFNPISTNSLQRNRAMTTDGNVSSSFTFNSAGYPNTQTMGSTASRLPPDLSIPIHLKDLISASPFLTSPAYTPVQTPHLSSNMLRGTTGTIPSVSAPGSKHRKSSSVPSFDTAYPSPSSPLEVQPASPEPTFGRHRLRSIPLTRLVERRRLASVPEEDSVLNQHIAYDTLMPPGERFSPKHPATQSQALTNKSLNKLQTTNPLSQTEKPPTLSKRAKHVKVKLPSNNFIEIKPENDPNAIAAGPSDNSRIKEVSRKAKPKRKLAASAYSRG